MAHLIQLLLITSLLQVGFTLVCNPKTQTCAKENASDLHSSFIFDGGSPFCEPKLGCFPLDGDFAERTYNVNPNSRNVINTQFLLFTRANKEKGHYLSADDTSTISKSHYDGKKPTKIIIHGFTDSATAAWFGELNNELLSEGDMNVINVEWGGIRASKTFYVQATANIRLVAAEIVYLLKTLQKVKSTSLDDVHVIGHSLGAHCAGYVGQHLGGAIGRITGLDPADPYFQGFGKNVRLDKTDAKFVDVIHSDSESVYESFQGNIGGFGTKDLSGHADYFPNGGERQPDCKGGLLKNIYREGDLFEAMRRQFACDHGRSVDYFIASINSCRFRGTRCTSYEDFLDSKCSLHCNGTDNCNLMGYHAHKPAHTGPNKYYLHTMGDLKNYCARDYRMKITLSKSSPALKGSLEFKVQGTNGLSQRVKALIDNDDEALKGGQSRSYDIGLPTMIGKPAKMEVKPVPHNTWWEFFSRSCSLFGFCAPEVKIDQVELTDQNTERYYFCGTGRSFEYKVSTALRYGKFGCGTAL